MEAALVLAAVAVPLLLNLRATQLAVRDDLYDRKQKARQLLLVWLIPVIGAVVVMAVHRRGDTPSRQYREDADPGDDFAYSGRAAKALREVLDGDD